MINIHNPFGQRLAYGDEAVTYRLGRNFQRVHSTWYCHVRLSVCLRPHWVELVKSGKERDAEEKLKSFPHTQVDEGCMSTVVISFMRQDNFPLSVPLELLLLFSFYSTFSYSLLLRHSNPGRQSGLFIPHPSIHSAVVVGELQRHYPSSPRHTKWLHSLATNHPKNGLGVCAK